MEWSLFLMVAVICVHCGWSIHSGDPYEFLRRGGDALGYYQWLPSVFIEHNVDRMPWTHGMESGTWISLFTLGVALLQLPFFLIGHLCASFLDYPMNGYSSPYGVAQVFGAATYAAAGTVLAFRLARRFSTTESALLAAVTLFSATNLFYYSLYSPTMSHVYSFFLVGLFSYCAIRIQDDDQRPARVVHVMLFVVTGSLLVLVRQLNILICLFPLLLALGSPRGVKEFVNVLTKRRGIFLLALFLALVPWVLQSMYWYHIVGEIVTFTYGKKGEHFEFDKMVPGMVMVGPRNGWLVYTPIMIPVLVLLVIYAWRNVQPARAILTVLVVVWLVYSAWWCWWLGSSFGYRGFVDIYALLAIPLAWVFRTVFNRTLSFRLVSACVLITLVVLNFGLTERYTWEWSFQSWSWQRFFEQVSIVFTG